MDDNFYRQLFETAPDGMMVTNTQMEIERINAAFSRMMGYQLADLAGSHPKLLVSERHNHTFFSCLREQLEISGYWQGEIWNKRKNGEVFPALLSASSIKNSAGQVTHYFAVFNDISSLKTAEQSLWKLAHYDALTGLLNRRALEQRLEEALSATRRSHRSGAVLFFDLDDFKKINDGLGHKAGDRLLIELAERLNCHLRKEDVFARLSGDEFVVLLTDLSGQLDEAAKATGGLIKNLLNTLREPFRIEGHCIYISASFGVTFFHPFANTVDEALKQADTAMYASKKQGKNTYTFYHPLMQQAANFRLQFETELREAIRTNQINLAYQPQYDQHQQLLGYEALVRWEHPQKGLIMPADFIAMAEETGIMIEMGEKIMHTACQQMAHWHRNGKDVPRLSINVSPSQFNHHQFVDMTLSAFKLTEVDPSKITLEITENLIVSNIDNIIEKMHRLKQWGVRFAIDDFGTGYSSLAYLKKMPIDELKIDRSFVRDILEDTNDAVIVNTILAMAEHLQLDIIAEGVENQAQMTHLVNSGCKGFQGYWFSKPLHYLDIQ